MYTAFIYKQTVTAKYTSHNFFLYSVTNSLVTHLLFRAGDVFNSLALNEYLDLLCKNTPQLLDE